MLNIEPLRASQIDQAALTFHRDGFVAISDALTPDQLHIAQAGAQRVIREQTDADPERKGNRGNFRYSFGSQLHHPEWRMLIDLPGILPIVEKIWGSSDFLCMGGGGDYSLPGAKIQHLHSDMGDFFNDPLKAVTFQDVPAPFIVVNFMMIDFTQANGAIRFVPCTQRSRASIPSLDDEPKWMKDSIVCAPAGTAIIRDVRCWHGGTANTSDQIRPMTSTGYYAPWFRSPPIKAMTKSMWESMSPTAQRLGAHLVE